MSALAKEALEKTAKEAAKNLMEKGAKEAATEAAERLAKKAAIDAAEKAAKEAATEAAEKIAKEAAAKAAKEAATEAAEKAAKEAAKAAAEKTAKKGAISTIKKGAKYAAVTVASLAAIGLGAEIYNKSKESFDKRNNKIFTITSIYNTPGASDGNISIKFTNPDKLKMYVREDVELSNTDINISGRFEILKVNGDFTEILIQKVETLTKQGTKGDIKLFADQNNDVVDVVEEGIKDVIDTVSDATGLGAFFESAKNGLIYFGIAVGVIGLLVLLGMIAKNVKSIRDLFSPPKKN